MIILNAPKEVWQIIIVDWLGTLRETVRLDLACSTAKVEQPLRSCYQQQSFKFSDDGNTSQCVLANMCNWIQSRQVCLYHIECNHKGYANSVLREWENLLMWCGERLTILRIHSLECDSTELFVWVYKYCTQIKDLSIDNVGTDFGLVCKILESCADTLVKLTFTNCMVQASEFFNLNRCFLSLKSLRFEYGFMGDFEHVAPLLRRCPNLKALFLENGDLQDIAVSTVAECCPSLQCLQLNNLFGVEEQSLLRIAKGCPNIEQLRITGCIEEFTDRFVDVMYALPKLHSLEMERPEVEEGMLLKIAARGAAPSLRVLATGTHFTFSGFREFTAACPHLTGLECFLLHEHDNSTEAGADITSLFEHCKELQHLVLVVYDGGVDEILDAEVLGSVAVCCPRLSTLELSLGDDYNSDELDAFLNKCPQLRTLIFDARFEVKVPLRNPKLLITGDITPFVEWMPPGTNF